MELFSAEESVMDLASSDAQQVPLGQKVEQ